MATAIKVIFRKFPDGQIIALFPLEPATSDGWLCESYMHVGQHGAADPGIVAETKRASVFEYDDLLWELIDRGYELKEVSRFPRNSFAVRKYKANRVANKPLNPSAAE